MPTPTSSCHSTTGSSSSSTRRGGLASDGSEIRSIEAQIYRCPVDEPFGYAKGFITVRESAVVRLVTADGTVGWGEAYAPAEATAAVIETVGPRFIEWSVFERAAIITEHATRCGDGLPSAPTAAALSAIALASLDAAGRILGRPAWTLLGGVAGDIGIFWLEEPLPPDRLEDYAALRATSAVPIAAGETVTSVPHARRWLDAKATDIFQPDVCLVGGLESATVIAEMAEGTGIALAPHCFGLGIGLASSLHWAAAIAAVRGGEEPTWLEVDTSPNLARDALLTDASWFIAGGTTLRLPNEPGLGIPDLRRIAEFR